MKIGSLFSGIGGIELGLELCGLSNVIWQCDSDPCARTVLKHHWPDVRVYNDVRSITHETAVRPDIICGGFPCQDISNAGKRAGITGERSGLWFEFARVIDELKPTYVFIENVAALASRGLSDVLRSLAACGYDAEWDVFSASEVGAPHRRERLFILAWRRTASDANCNGESVGAVDDEASELSAYGSVAADSDGSNLRKQSVGVQGRDCASVLAEHGKQGTVADANCPRLEVRSVESAEQPTAERSRLQDNPWSSEPRVRVVDDGISFRVDKLRLLGNAVVPQTAVLAWRTLIARACS